MPTAVHRIEVRPRESAPDPRGDAALREAAALGLSRPPTRIETAAVYLIEGGLAEEEIHRLAHELLADPLTETATIGAAPTDADALVEVHPLPGVMDPDAEAVELAIRAMLGERVRVSTGRRYDLWGTDPATARLVAERSLANPVIHAIHDHPHRPESFVAGSRHSVRVVTISIEDMDDPTLERFARHTHLFLSLGEMKAIQAEYRRLGRDPREIELETIAQTWSEHCVHKTLKSTIRYVADPTAPGLEPGWAEGRPGHTRNADGSVTIDNLFASTIVAATRRLIDEGGIDWCLSVFDDNAGVIAFDNDNAICFKVETHNHPSAIEPYGGAATGIGGCIRDIIGTGLAARPIAATDVFCVAYPDRWRRPNDEAGQPESMDAQKLTLPAGCLHPKRILRQVVAGVRDYGNRMGIPTLNGAVWFDDDYVGNPLVFCGCVGVMPRDRIAGAPAAGDSIVVIGGRTGRDGIHGATFSSAPLSGGHADEFSHAVQIGNAVTEKKLLDAILQARDQPDGPLFGAITDCGAGGFSSAVGEMGRDLGAEVRLEQVRLKYEGLSPTEIWISEAQERMVLAVPPAAIEKLRAICRLHDVEMCVLGRFGTPDRELILTYRQQEVGRISMEFLHQGRPKSTLQATWSPPPPPGPRRAVGAPSTPSGPRAGSIGDVLVELLGHPNIASKRWIIRQYDHEVQGGSVIKPLVGPGGEGPSDAAVILPVAGSSRGLAIANGLATGLRDDPYLMTLAAIDECVRNLVAVGADPRRIALLDNFCWPSCTDGERLGALVRAAEACYDGALAYGAPFISGKDSLNNQFLTDTGRTIEIPPTLLVSGMGIVPYVRRSITLDAKTPGNLLIVVGPPVRGDLGGSHLTMVSGDDAGHQALPAVDLSAGPRAARMVGRLINEGLVRSCHDISDGGLLVAAAEMAMAGGLGLRLKPKEIPATAGAGETAVCRLFSEEPSRYLLEIDPQHLQEIRSVLQTPSDAVAIAVIGDFDDSGRLRSSDNDFDLSMETIKGAFLGTLDW